MKHKSTNLIIGFILLVSVGLGGCSAQSLGIDEQTNTVNLYVLAASSLMDVLTALGEAYKEVAPDVKVNFSFDSSGTLARQIEEGAPADLFLSANMKQMEGLEEGEYIIDSSVIKLLQNQVVLIQPKGSRLKLEGFEEVATDEVGMVAIGSDHVPVGNYTKSLYTRLGLWEEVAKKANFATSVRQVLDWVATGNADCGIVYATDAVIEAERVKVVAVASKEQLPEEVVYPVGIVRTSKVPEEARNFLMFLVSPQAEEIFKHYGFEPYTQD